MAEVERAGGALCGNQLHRLYDRLDSAKDIIHEAGGLRFFCDRSDRLRFIADPPPYSGPGEVRIARHEELERQLAAAKTKAKSAKKAKAKAEAQAEAEAASRAELRRELRETKEQAQRFCDEAFAAEHEKIAALAKVTTVSRDSPAASC